MHTFRPILNDISWGKPIRFTDFKGSPATGDKPCESRICQVNSDDQGNVWWTLAHGPGEETKTGAFKPAYKKGQHEKLIRVKMTRDESRQMAYQVLEYLQAFTAVQILQRTQPKVVLPLSIEEANEDWFSVHNVRPHVNGNGYMNGHGGTAVAAKPKKLSHFQLHKQKKYANGQPVHPDDLSHYDAYYYEKSRVPGNRDRLIEWVYK